MSASPNLHDADIDAIVVGWWSLYSKRETTGCVPTIGESYSQPPWESLLQGTGEENSAYSRTSDSGGTMRFSSWPWNTGPALSPLQGIRGFMGIYPTSPHVLCGLGESCSTAALIAFCGSMESDLCRTRAGAWFALPTVSQTCPRCMLDSDRAALCHRFCLLCLRVEAELILE